MSSIYRKAPPLFGAALDAAIATTPPVRPFLIEGILLQESVTMVAAEPGTGKSSLLLSVAVPASIGSDVFGSQKVLRPLKVYIFCPERSATELRERLHTIRQFIPFDTNNICIDDGMTGTVDISNPLCINEIKSGIRTAFPKGCDLFCVEGMYGMSRLPLASEETANLFYRFNADMIREFGLSIWYSNHTTKRRKDWKGNDLALQFFGSQMLLANVTAAYVFERLTEKNVSRLFMFKDTVSGLASEMRFQYDAERCLLDSLGATAGADRLRQFLTGLAASNGTFTYADAQRVTDLSRSQLMRLLTGQVDLGIIDNTSANGKKALYKVLKRP